MKFLGFGSETLPSVIKDPFAKNKIVRIHVSVSEHVFHKGYFTATGTVEFENGNTKGEQKFTGKTFDDVVLQIKAMLDNF